MEFDKTPPPKYLQEITILNSLPGIAIRHLTVGVPGMLIDEELTLLIKKITNQLPDFPKLTYPHILQSLRCYEPLAPTIFSALDPTVNLNCLELSLFSFTTLKFNHQLMTYRSLRTLIVSDTPTYPDFDCTVVIDSVNGFIQNLVAPSLTDVQISYPTPSLLTVTGDCTLVITKFLTGLPYLKNLSIGVCSPNQNNAPPQKNFSYPVDLLEEMEALGQRLQLNSIFLKDNHLHSLRPSVQTKAWIVFIKQQRRLKSLRFYLKSAIEFESDVSTIIRHNLNYLQKVDLSCFPCEIEREDGYVTFIPIDCVAFKDCCKLSTLKLADKTVNTTDLPNCLRNIYIDAMLTNEDAHVLLVTDFTQVNLIELKDSRGGAPKGLGYGIPVNSLRETVKRRVIRRLVIHSGSTDDKFPPNGIPNKDAENAVYLRKVKRPRVLFAEGSGRTGECNSVRIDWQLNDEGYYEEGELMKHIEDQVNHNLYQCKYLFSVFR